MISSTGELVTTTSTTGVLTVAVSVLLMVAELCRTVPFGIGLSTGTVSDTEPEAPAAPAQDTEPPAAAAAVVQDTEPPAAAPDPDATVPAEAVLERDTAELAREICEAMTIEVEPERLLARALEAVARHLELVATG